MSGVRVRTRDSKRCIIGVGILTLFVAGFIEAAAQEKRPVDPVIPSTWVFTLPAGDPLAGEKAFEKMQCFSCHKVTGRTFEDAEPETGGIGPEFTPGYAKLPAGYLAESILNFNRFIPHANFKVSYMSLEAFKPAGTEDYETNSRMASYNEIMTLKEMIDIVAFLKSLDKIPPK